MAYYPYFSSVSPPDGYEGLSITHDRIACYCTIFTTPTFDFGTSVNFACDTVDVTTDVPGADPPNFILGSTGPKTWGGETNYGTPLEYSTTYHQQWTFSGDLGSFTSDNFSFVTEAGAAPTKAENPTPANNATEVDFSGLELSWDDGGGADTFNVYIGKTGALTLVSSAQAGTDYTTTIAELETIFGASPINQKVYWRVDATNDAGTTEGDEWNFDPRPAKASTPSPTDAMTTMTLDWSAFSWDEATAALTYDVYAGTETGEGIPDSNMTLIVTDGELYTIAQAYMLTAMNVVYPNTGAAVHSYTYYWKVNTKNAFGVTEGDFWSFTTIDFDQPKVSYVLVSGDCGGSGAGPYDDPPGVEGTDWRFTGENNLVTLRRLVSAANDKIWFEEI